MCKWQDGVQHVAACVKSGQPLLYHECGTTDKKSGKKWRGWSAHCVKWGQPLHFTKQGHLVGLDYTMGEHCMKGCRAYGCHWCESSSVLPKYCQRMSFHYRSPIYPEDIGKWGSDEGRLTPCTPDDSLHCSMQSDVAKQQCIQQQSHLQVQLAPCTLHKVGHETVYNKLGRMQTSACSLDAPSATWNVAQGEWM